jgi:hypothetical protein
MSDLVLDSSMRVESGPPASVGASRNLGHIETSITLAIYAHVICDAQRRAVERVAGILDYFGLQSEPDNELIR